MSIGYNIHGSSGVDKGYLYSHLHRLRPGGTYVVLDQVEMAGQIQAVTGGTVYHRRLKDIHSDDNLQRRISPEDFVASVEDVIAAGLGVYVNNEPSWSHETISWLTEVASRLVSVGAKAVLGNWSIGVPEPEHLYIGKPLIEYVQAHADLLAIGLHEGCLSHWTDGIDGIDIHNMEEFDVNTASMWYSGRFRRMYDQFGPFPIVITEWGFDNFQADGAPIHRIAPIWERKFYRADTEMFAYEQLEQVDEAIYSRYNIPICLYCWGAAAPRWRDYDWSQFAEVHRLLERLSHMDQPRNLITVKIVSDAVVKVRAEPTVAGQWLGQLKPGDIISMDWGADAPNTVPSADDPFDWVYLQKGGLHGYSAADFLTVVREEHLRTLDEVIEILRTVRNQAQSDLDEAIRSLELLTL